MAEEPPELLVPDVESWRAWLAEHHGDENGVRLVLAKKGTTEPTSLTYEQALQEALCQGWIDGQVGRRDDATMYQRFTPRRKRSMWSLHNVTRVERLIAEGRMQPSGQAAIDAAKADGRWDRAYHGPGSMQVPDDVTAALAANAAAAATWAGLTSQNRYAILFRLTHLRTPAARARNIEQYVDMLARGETIHPQRGSQGRKPPTF
jgi:uncharacterized protein YdeI (YjbR/CyaY-like superfamily)